MNKGDLITKVAKNANLTKAQSQQALDAAIKAMTESLKKNQKITLAGFGTFQVKKRKARTGRNPQTGKIITFPPNRFVGFKAGKALKEATNKKK